MDAERYRFAQDDPSFGIENEGGGGMAMRGRYQLILLIVVLDAMGIGIVFPTMPALLRQLLHGGSNAEVARHYGWLLAAYASTTLFSSPVLGVLSDRYGRRPVLLAGLFGTAFDDLVMALAPTLPFLYLGRTLAGVTGASLTVATAYIADRSDEESRAREFGRMNACFGIGFIAGPMLGGLAGNYAVRAPFFLAAGLNGVSALLCFLLLPESRVAPASAEKKAHVTLRQLNPLAPLGRIGSVPGIGRLLFVFGTLNTVNQVTGVLWVVYGTARFGWSPGMVGVSLAVYGLLSAVCQTFLPGRAERRLGRRGTVLAGMVADALGFLSFGLVRATPGALGTIPLFALSGLSLPSLQALLSSRVSEERQGELQGVLTSLTSVIAVLCPIAASSLYVLLQERVPRVPGMIWLLLLPLFLPCFAVMGRKGEATPI